MQITVTVKLNPTAEQFALLLETVKRCNAACDCLSEIAFTEGIFRHYDLHKRAYYGVRKAFQLPSCHAVRCLAKVAHSYKLDKATRRTFRPTGAIELDTNLLRWFVDKKDKQHKLTEQVDKTDEEPKLTEPAVGITTLQGRLKIPFFCSAEQWKTLQSKRGQADLTLRDGTFYLGIAVTISEADPFTPSDCIGVDLGIANVATDSEGNRYTGEPVKKVRKKYRRIRQLLQPRKTRSARKHLQKVRRKESRFVKDVNHCISKKLVCIALDRQKALSIETLTGIRGRGNGLNRAMRTELNNWAFNQLKQFIVYKATRVGVTVIEVDPRYSSQTCSNPACGHCEKANRKSQDCFECLKCGLKLNADYNAALNLKARGILSYALMFRSTTSVVG